MQHSFSARPLRPTLQELPPALRDVVQNELSSGEKIIWVDVPVPRLFTMATIVPMVFAIPWTAFAIFWTVKAGGFFEQDAGNQQIDKTRLVFSLFGVPFILIGLAMLSTPLWVRRVMRSTVYAVTDRRAIVFSGGVLGSRSVQTFDPARLASMERIERADGSGDLIFEHFTSRHGSGTATIRRGFLCVHDVRGVEQLLRDTLLKDRARAIET